MRWFRRRSEKTEINRLRDVMSIDTFGPEFFDLYPTKGRAIEIVRETGVVRSEYLQWVVDVAADAGWDGRTAVRNLVRSGRLLSADELRSIGLRSNRKVGDDFVRRISAKDKRAAIEELEAAIHFARSEANQLHNLRRSEEIGVTHVVFMSPRDERGTKLENELDGRRMTVNEARQLVRDRGREIVRSTFRSEIKY